MILESGNYHIAYLDLLNKTSENLVEQKTTDSIFKQVSRLYQSKTELEWIQYPQFGNKLNEVTAIRESWHSEVLNDIRQFMNFPILSRVVKNEQGFCAWFADQRFIFRGDTCTISV